MLDFEQPIKQKIDKKESGNDQQLPDFQTDIEGKEFEYNAFSASQSFEEIAKTHAMNETEIPAEIMKKIGNSINTVFFYLV